MLSNSPSELKKTLECSLSRGQALQGPSNSTVFVCMCLFGFFPCSFFLEFPVSVQSGGCALCPLLNCCPEKKKKKKKRAGSYGMNYAKANVFNFSFLH